MEESSLADLVARAFNSIKDFATPWRINGHGFLCDHIAPKLKRSYDVDVVCTIDSGYDHFIWFALLNHAVKVCRFVGWNLGMPQRLQLFVGEVEPRLVGVAERYDLGRRLVGGRDS